jgi:uncharacterized membrane protein
VKRLRSVFVTGLLVTLPVLATVEILLWFIQTVDNNARYLLPRAWLPFDFWGLGLVLALGLILVAGALTENHAGKWLVSLLDTALRHTPFVGGIYGGIQKFLETIFNPRNDQFKGTVLVEFPREGIYSIGFRTGMPDPRVARKTSEGEALVNVFVPCTPNPTSGFYLMVPEQKLIPLDLSVQEAFKIVISMGLVTGDEGKAHK